MSRCFSAGLLCVGLVLSAHGADRVELNDGWLFTPEEAIELMKERWKAMNRITRPAA